MKSGAMPIVSFLLFLFGNGVAEAAQLSAQGEIFAVGICHYARLLEIYLALAVKIFFVNIGAEYLRYEHIMGAERLYINHSAFK